MPTGLSPSLSPSPVLAVVLLCPALLCYPFCAIDNVRPQVERASLVMARAHLQCQHDNAHTHTQSESEREVERERGSCWQRSRTPQRFNCLNFLVLAFCLPKSKTRRLLLLLISLRLPLAVLCPQPSPFPISLSLPPATCAVRFLFRTMWLQF